MITVLTTAAVAAAPPKVTVNPNPTSLPGSPQLQQLIDGLAFWMLLAAVASVLIAAGTWGRRIGSGGTALPVVTGRR